MVTRTRTGLPEEACEPLLNAPANALAGYWPDGEHEVRWIMQPDRLWTLYREDSLTEPRLKLTAIGAAVLAGA